MPADYLPTREADLVNFADNFNTVIAVSPTTFGLTAGMATSFSTLNSSWSTAYAAAVNPPTRTVVTIADKNTAKDALVNGPGGIRQLAALVQAHPGITAGQLEQRGLRCATRRLRRFLHQLIRQR